MDSQSLQQSMNLLKNKYNVSKNKANNNNVKSLIAKLDKLVINFSYDLDVYRLTQEKIRSDIDDFDEISYIPRNIIAEQINPISSTHLGCFRSDENNVNASMTYTGNMSFERCMQNTVDLKQPYFTLRHNNGDDECYVGNNMYDIIKNGSEYNKQLLWSTSNFDESAQLKVLNSTFVIVVKGAIVYSNNYEQAAKELNGESSTKKSKFLLRSDGLLVLMDETENIIWSAQQNDRKSMSILSWIPENNPTNKYKRSFLETGESIVSGETVSSKNGKYLLELNSALELYGATSACYEEKVGNIDSVALHMINDAKYSFYNDSESSGRNKSSGPIDTLGECLHACDMDETCTSIQYEKNNTNMCSLKSDTGTIFKTKQNVPVIVAEKNLNNIIDNQKYIGKVGYIDEMTKLSEYPASMVSYKNDKYEKLEQTSSVGNEIARFVGNPVEGIIKCNEIQNCAGFIYDEKTKEVKLKDKSMYPSSNKFFSENENLYLRGMKINNHASCIKDVEKMDVDLWKKYELLNKITLVNPETHKCGVVSFVDENVKELERLYVRLNDYTNEVNKTIQLLLSMNVTLGHDVKTLQNKLSSTLDGIMTTNNEMKYLHEKYKKNGGVLEGFDVKNTLDSIVDIKCNISQDMGNRWLLYSSIFAIFGGFYFLSKK